MKSSSASDVILNAAVVLLMILCNESVFGFLPQSSSSSLSLPSTSNNHLALATTSCTTKLNLLNLLQQQPEASNGANSGERSIPFIIDRVSDRPNDRVFDEISDMCIEVFFNEDEGQPPPWKNMQLGYLRGIQSADLRRRRTNPESKNEMLVARRVIPMDSPEVAQSTPLILDWNQIYNMEERIPKNKKTPTMDYVRGEILGFCEVTQRAYGLGDDDKPRRMQSARQFSASSVRPILTNLSVKDEARKSGIGSQLVEACEATVAQWETSNGNVPTEIILEVESDNEKALAFYKKRGYEEVFTDPACRRYTTSGFFLSKERCSKICMRKELSASGSSSSEQKAPAMDLSKMLQSIRENVFN